MRVLYDFMLFWDSYFLGPPSIKIELSFGHYWIPFETLSNIICSYATDKYFEAQKTSCLMRLTWLIDWVVSRRSSPRHDMLPMLPRSCLWMWASCQFNIPCEQIQLQGNKAKSNFYKTFTIDKLHTKFTKWSTRLLWSPYDGLLRWENISETTECLADAEREKTASVQHSCQHLCYKNHCIDIGNHYAVH